MNEADKLFMEYRKSEADLARSLAMAGLMDAEADPEYLMADERRVELAIQTFDIDPNRRAEISEQIWCEHRYSERVEHECDRCPDCHEDRLDLLEWPPEATCEFIVCLSCGRAYEPGYSQADRLWDKGIGYGG